MVQDNAARLARLEQLVRLFVARRDWEMARRYADLHPELWNLGVIHVLMTNAYRASERGEHEYAQLLASRAGLLTGSHKTDAPALLTELVDVSEVLKSGRHDAETLRSALDIAGAAAGEAFHPLMAAKVLDAVGWLLAMISTYTGERAVLDDAIEVTRRAVELTPPADTGLGLPVRLNNLAIHLGDLYTATGERAVLDEALEAARRAVRLTPPANTDLPAHLSTLANMLAGLYAATGERAVLDEAVEAARRAVELATPANTIFPAHLSTLARLLARLWAATGERAVLDEALEAARRAVRLTPPADTDLPGYLNNLADLLADLYTATGERAVLDEAVEAARRAVELTPPTATYLAGYLNDC
jgi:tetratricopeptide (TPR) repeat protein